MNFRQNFRKLTPTPSEFGTESAISQPFHKKTVRQFEKLILVRPPHLLIQDRIKNFPPFFKPSLTLFLVDFHCVIWSKRHTLSDIGKLFQLPVCLSNQVRLVYYIKRVIKCETEHNLSRELDERLLFSLLPIIHIFMTEVWREFSFTFTK